MLVIYVCDHLMMWYYVNDTDIVFWLLNDNLYEHSFKTNFKSFAEIKEAFGGNGDILIDSGDK